MLQGNVSSVDTCGYYKSVRVRQVSTNFFFLENKDADRNLTFFALLAYCVHDRALDNDRKKLIKTGIKISMKVK